MVAWDSDEFGPQVVQVQVELYTAGFRVSGKMATRFRRVADILNLTSSTHLIVEDAAVADYADPANIRSGGQVMVPIDAVLFGISTGVDDRGAEELRIPKRPVQTQIAVRPFWLAGMVHVPQGSRPMDGLLNASDRFLALTDVSVTCAEYSLFNFTAPVLAVQRSLAEVLLSTDDEAPDELLADILPEDAVRSWLPPPPEEPA
jgi:hypothetical protein